MPAFSDPSDRQACVQWPSRPTRPWAGGPLRLAVMASGAGSNFEALVKAGRSGDLAATVSTLVVNRSECGAVERAARLGVPCRVLDHRLHDSREALDQALLEVFQSWKVDLVVMAGWMRIVTPVLIEALPGRLINIHPSLLPSFPGLDAVGQALRAGVRISGCTAHLVSEAVDAGPILVQAAVPVHSDDDHASLSRRIQEQEHRILPLAVLEAAERLGLQG